jgi:hypothetical protein
MLTVLHGLLCLGRQLTERGASCFQLVMKEFRNKSLTILRKKENINTFIETIVEYKIVIHNT